MDVGQQTEEPPAGPWTRVLLELPGRPTVELTDDPERVDLQSLWQFLSTSAYWGRWRNRADLGRQVAGSWRVVTAHLNGRQVGFARAVSDGVALAYLADVYVQPDARGLGVGRALLRLMIDDGPGAAFRWMLHTRDAHGLYAEFGFASPGLDYLERPGRNPSAIPSIL